MNRRDALKSAAALGLLSFGVVPQRDALAQEATPPADESAAALEGLLSTNVDALPTADEGNIQVVLQSAPLDAEVGFIIHNNSHRRVAKKDIIGMARDADDTLVGVLDSEFVSPQVIEPGQYSIGIATFDKALPADTKIELQPTFEEPGASRGAYLDFAVTEVTVDGESVIGIVENQTRKDSRSLSHVLGLFFDEDGEIVGVTRGYLDNSDLVSGELTTFSTWLKGGTATDSFVFAASGREA